MEYDNYIIENEGINEKIYPLFEITKNETLYLIYTKDINNVADNIYVGEIKDNKVIPVPDELMSSFNEIIKDI